MSGDSGARQFARDAMIVEADTALLIDVDTPADLERAQFILAAKAR
jgi:CTP:molybdopterin cytidylyltransferase MocA